MEKKKIDLTKVEEEIFWANQDDIETEEVDPDPSPPTDETLTETFWNRMHKDIRNGIK